MEGQERLEAGEGTARISRLAYCRSILSKKHVLGIAMLIIVDLIWVGSAGLTRYLFKNMSYSKPLFTVYFKTALFAIYLVAFVFWRPWQRLCCVECKTKKKTRMTGSIQESNQCHTETRESITNGTAGSKSMLFASSSSESCDVRGDINITDNMLGPSEFTPLRCNDPDELHRPISSNSLTLPSDALLHSRIVTTSYTPIARRKIFSRVRFSRTVEVKHVPCEADNDGVISTSGKSLPGLLSARQVALLAAVFGVMWFFANYLYAKALDIQSVAAVNTLSSTSGLFVLILAAFPLPRIADKDRFTLSKFVITLISISGVVMVGVSSSSDHTGGTINVGAIFTVAGAALYACYLVLLYKVVPSSESLEIPMFFGFVGLFDAVVLLPCLVMWHYLGWEEFQWPPTPNIWTLLLVNGFVGTVLSELLWLWGTLLTSSLVGTLSLSLVTPLSIVYSIVIGESHFSILFFVGALCIAVSFVCVAIVDYWGSWDPLWLGLKRVVTLAKDYRVHRGYTDLHEESKCLLDHHNNQTHDICSPPINSV